MLLSREDLEQLAVMHPEVAAYMEKNPRPDVSVSDHTGMRRGMELIEKTINDRMPKAPAGTEFCHGINMRDGHGSSLKIHKPADQSPGPLIVLFFGGGFVGGSHDQLTFNARPLVNLFGATVVCPSYRLAPEYKFPISQYDAWDSMKWIAENATGDILHADPSKGFLIGGSSAGGAMSAALSRKFQEEPLVHPLTGQWLCITPTLWAGGVPEKYRQYYLSPDQMSKGNFLSRESREMLKRIVEFDDASDLRYAINSKTPVSGQPRTYFQIDGMDPVRDDGLIYDEILKEAGVQTKVDLYPGCPHGHMMMSGLEVSSKANVDTTMGFAWLLGKEVQREVAAEESRKVGMCWH